jgi:hypothetical protein
MPLPQRKPDADDNNLRQSLPKIIEQVEDPVKAKLPALSREFQRYHILDALLKALPDLGKSIARAHYHLTVDQTYTKPSHAEAKEKIKQLITDPDAVASHEPWWHEYGIVTHTKKVVDVAQNKLPLLPDLGGNLHWALSELASRKIGDLSQLELLIISLPLHDLGKFQPIIKRWEEGGIDRAYHTGHERRGGDLVAAARSDNPPHELDALTTIFNSFAITPRQLDYIEQCVRLHFEFGKVRLAATNASTGYSLRYTQTREFENMCREVAKEHATVNHDSDMSLEKGVLFLFDSAGKTNFEVQNNGGPDEWAQHVREIGADPKLLGAFRQYHINIAVGLRYLELLRKNELA